MASEWPKWSEITREERFFTSHLYHDLNRNTEPLISVLRELLRLSSNITVVDHCFELCFFRDIARRNLIKDIQELKKQTFDLVLTLSDNSLVIIEAKAHQGFHTKQIEMLHLARRHIRQSKHYHKNNIYLVALCSSEYKPKLSTQKKFDALITWRKISSLYPKNEVIYDHADAIYGD